jgi:hypothetical protein
MKDEVRIFLLVVLLVVILYFFFTKRSMFERFETYEMSTPGIPSQPYNYNPPKPGDSPDVAPTQHSNTMPSKNQMFEGASQLILEHSQLSYSLIEPYTDLMNTDNTYSLAINNPTPVVIKNEITVAPSAPPSLGTQVLQTAQDANNITNNILKSMSSQFSSTQ